MLDYQRVILKILNLSLHNKKLNLFDDYKLDWEKIIQVSRDHKISGLIYYSVDKKNLRQLDKNIIDNFKNEIVKININEIRKFNIIKKIISDLTCEGIEVIILKGMVLRQLYPLPELRSMRDFDVLVKQEDYAKAKKHLLNNGFEYVPEGTSDIHEEFILNENTVIELHSKLINNNINNIDTSEYEKRVWKNKVNFNLDSISTNTLCNEDFIIHLCLHMATHIKYCGFGLRQLYDLAAFVQANNKNINWQYVIKNIEECNISKFTKAIFMIISKEFNVEVPNIIIDTNIKSEELDILLDNIFSSGVYGRSKEINNSKDAGIIEKIRKYISVLFPDSIYMGMRYSYVSTHKYLLPIAWFHRVFQYIFSSKKSNQIGISCNKISRRIDIIKIFNL